MSTRSFLERFGPSRALHADEQAFLQNYFADSLDYARIRIGVSIGQRCWSPFGGRISLTRGCFVGGTSRRSVALQDALAASVLAHEALHVWQRQHGRWVTLHGIPLQVGYALRMFDPYRYEHSDDPAEMLKRFRTGNIEQQGRMFQHYVYESLCRGELAPYRALARHVAALARTPA